MSRMRGMVLTDPAFAGVISHWFRLEEEMLLLGLGDRVAEAAVREEMDFGHEIWVRCWAAGHRTWQ